jgi:hypothetical protein
MAVYIVKVPVCIVTEDFLWSGPYVVLRRQYFPSLIYVYCLDTRTEDMQYSR